MGDMTGLQTRCPTCNGAFGVVAGDDTPPDIPPHGAAASCALCGNLWVWDEQVGWQAPTPEQRASLIDDQEMVDLITFGREIAEARARDRDNLVKLITYAMLGVASGRFSVDVGAAALVDTLMAAGFHTHPTEPDDV